jgi:hypothetical protein
MEMRLRIRTPIIGACLLLCFSALLVGAVDEPQAALPPVESTPKNLTGLAPTLVTGSDPDYRNVIVGNVSAGFIFDSGGYYSSTVTGTTSSADERYFVQPSIAIRQTRPTAIWTLSYTPGFSQSFQTTDSGQYSQNAAGDLLWAPSHRWTLHVRQDYSVTTNPFETVGRVPLLPELGGPFAPTYNGILANSKRTALVSNADISYRLTPRLAVGVTGGYQNYDYGPAYTTVSGSTVLYSAEQFNGSVFVSDQITRRQVIGLQAMYSDQYSHGLTSRTQVPALLLFDNIEFGPHTLLTVWGGPSNPRGSGTFPVTPTLILQLKSNEWQPMMGATFAWNGKRNAINVQYVHQIQNMGGLMTTVTSNFGSAGFRSRLTKRWTGYLRFDIDNQVLWAVTSSDITYRSSWAGGAVSYDFNRHGTLRVDAAWVK